MKFWYYSFEGRYRPTHPRHAGCGVLSTCLVPLANPSDAELLVKEGLAYHDIDLVTIDESFEVDPEELDVSKPDNKKWLDWCEETKREDTVLFDPWQIFDHEE